MSDRLDDKDAAILAKRIAAWNEIKGARVGDFVHMLDGTVRRFTHDWANGLQVTVSDGDSGSFYFGDGYMSYSGGLDPIIPLRQLLATDEIRTGQVWFFHHDEHRAHNGVYTMVPCRVFEQVP